MMTRIEEFYAFHACIVILYLNQFNVCIISDSADDAEMTSSGTQSQAGVRFVQYFLFLFPEESLLFSNNQNVFLLTVYMCCIENVNAIDAWWHTEMAKTMNQK